MTATKIIIDTDIGDDIDDAFALQYALNHPALDLVGVTTVFKNAYQRALVAKTLLKKNGRGEIGVYVGESLPLKEPVSSFAYEHRTDGEVDILPSGLADPSCLPEREGAVDFLIRSASPEITLVCIGPATNLAKAILRAPARVKQYREIVMMCGNTDRIHEWNVMCDPEALSIVLSAGLDIRLVGVNVTEQCFFGLDELLENLSYRSEAADFLNAMMKDWIVYNMRPPIMHDALAVSAVLHDFVKFRRCDATVPLEGEDRGAILFGQTSGNGVLTSESVDSAAFLRHFSEIRGLSEKKEVLL